MVNQSASNTKAVSSNVTVGDFIGGCTFQKHFSRMGDEECALMWGEIKKHSETVLGTEQSDELYGAVLTAVEFAKEAKKPKDVQSLTRLSKALERSYIARSPKARTPHHLRKLRQNPDGKFLARFPAFKQDVLRLARSMGIDANKLKTMMGLDALVD